MAEGCRNGGEPLSEIAARFGVDVSEARKAPPESLRKSWQADAGPFVLNATPWLDEYDADKDKDGVGPFTHAVHGHLKNPPRGYGEFPAFEAFHDRRKIYHADFLKMAAALRSAASKLKGLEKDKDAYSEEVEAVIGNAFAYPDSLYWVRR